MLRISKLADYATLILSELAREADKLSPASLLSKKLGLSLPVVSKILKMLGRAELVSSVRGAEGGYRLAREPKDISLAQVVHAIEGRLAMTECCSQQSACALDTSCATKGNWQVINKVIYATLTKVSLQDMMGSLV